MNNHRDAILSQEVYYVVLRLVQIRDFGSRLFSIRSVKSHGIELKTSNQLKKLDLTTADFSCVKTICNQIGFHGTVKGVKNDIEINGSKCSIRCLYFTNRPLINHSHRRKFEKVCSYLGMDITILDGIISGYWDRRLRAVFGEDVQFSTPLNPFLKKKGYLSKLLTAFAFNTFDYHKEATEPGFVKETIDLILDYREPADESTWSVFTHKTYLDSVWTSLCFSMRGDRGMPSEDKLFLPENADLIIWTQYLNGWYKGALHIRIKHFDTADYEGSFEDRFKDVIESIHINLGEKDEVLVKLYLTECKKNKKEIPIGNSRQLVTSVRGSNGEYGIPDRILKWDTLDAEDLVYECSRINIIKSGHSDKSDVFVNGIGISIKSERGAPPSLINHTTRDKILRVMQSINHSIFPLDQIISRYWELREQGKIAEDVGNINMLSPFSSEIDSLKPLLNYFAFRGTGSGDSKAPARFVLSVGIPDDVTTWSYYDEQSFIDAVWDRLIFSLRSKGMPSDYDPEDEKYKDVTPWVRFIDEKYKGALSARIDKRKD